MTRMIRSSCKRADAVTAVSRHTKKDLVSHLKMDAGKISVIPEAVDRDRYRVMEDRERLEAARRKYGLGDKIILFTGSMSPRKNLARLMTAFDMISDQMPYELIITGGKDWNNSAERSLMHKNPRIRNIGFVPENEMACLYNLADIYVYPSLYEGFGLPVLEAQACGVPVVAANTTSIPEVGRDSVHYMDPTDIPDMAAALLKVATDRVYRHLLIQKGFGNLAHFSWDAGAKALLEICAKLADP
jgi:glycosyltransferase involved in cell wall biosynthesis